MYDNTRSPDLWEGILESIVMYYALLKSKSYREMVFHSASYFLSFCFKTNMLDLVSRNESMM